MQQDFILNTEGVMLEVRGLVKRYGGVTALAGVDLDVPRGMFGLLGPNGAGKSTLMRTLATLQQPDAGTARLDNIDMLAHPDRVRAKLGYLPQDFGVYPGISARRLLEYMAVLKGVVDGRARATMVDALLERVHLERDAHREVAAFSGGMRQRFGIAQALIGDPYLFIVDEPTAGLDPEERNRLQHLLADLGERAIVLLSTHLVEDVANLCTGVAILAGGRVVDRGSPRELASRLEGRLFQARVPRAQLEAYESHRPLHARPRPDGVELVVVTERPPPGFEARSPELEDYYHYALGRARGERAS